MPAAVTDHFLAGIFAGTVSAALLYPLDLIKVRYQVYDKEGRAYKSILSAFRTIIKEESIFGLFKGLSPAVLASAASWGGYFYCYENAKSSGGSTLHSTDHLLAGIEAGVILVFLTNPLWLIKTRLQLQGKAASDHPKYKGPLDAARTIWREEGLRGMYRGVVPALFLTSHGAIQFAVYEKLKDLCKSSESSSQGQPAYVSMAIGGIAKSVATVATYPYQVIKSRLQMRDNITTNSAGYTERTAKYRGVIDCVVKIARREGIVGYFRGIVPNALKVAPQAALTFVLYEEAMKILVMASPDSA